MQIINLGTIKKYYPKMKSVCPGLWKQIGSQMHKKEYLTSIAQNKLTYEPQIVKYENQQINIALEESAINVLLNDLELEENEKDCIEELNLFKLGRKLTASSDVLGLMLRELPGTKQSNAHNDEQTQKNSCFNSTGFQQKLIKTCKIVKNTTKQLQIALNSLKLDMELVLSKIWAELNKQINQLQGMYQLKFQALSKSYIGKCLQADNLQKLYQQKLQNQKSHQLAQANSDKQIVRQRTQIYRLKKEITSANIQKTTKLRENTELSEKVFDLEQKMSGFDLRVEKAVELAFEKISNRANEEKNQEQIQNQCFLSVRSRLNQKKYSPSKKPVCENISNYQPKYVQSKFASPKKNSSFAELEEKNQVEKSTQIKFTAKKSFERLFEKNMYESHPVNSFKSPIRDASTSDFFRQQPHSYSQRLKTTNSKELLTIHNFSGFTKKEVLKKEVRKEEKVDNISQKINKIRAKIDSEIKNITVYKQKKSMNDI